MIGKFLVATLALTLLSGIATATAKPATDLSAFKGSYPGAAVLVGSDNSTFGGSAQTAFQVASSGRSAVVTVNYTLTIGGTPRAFVETYALQRSGVCILNEAIPTNSKSSESSATYTARAKLITFAGTFNDGGAGSFFGVMTLKVRKHRQTLTIFHTGSVPGTYSASFAFTGSRHIRK